MFSLVAIGKGAGLIGFGTFVAAAAYDFHRGSDQNTSINEIRLEQTQLLRDAHESKTQILNAVSDLKVELMTAVRDKQEACKVLEASVQNAKYSHTYCKD